MADEQRHHFLFITSSTQSHINPALHLAKHLSTSTGVAVTFSTTVFAHRRMFSSSTPNSDQQHFTDGLITFIPYSDGYDNGYKHETSSTPEKHHSRVATNGKRSVSKLIGNLAGRGQPVTCVIYTILLNWVPEVAGEHNIPSVLFWIQAATAFAAYYHCFHGFESLVKEHIDDLSFTVSFPGLQPLQIRDLPSFFRAINDSDTQDGAFLRLFKELFEILDKEQERLKSTGVLINTFQEWETDGLASVTEIKTIPVGHLPRDTNSGAGHLFKEDDKKYMEWLDTKEEGSVVYISFGSLSVMKKEQIEEIVKGLKESKRPYLWVVRKDNREEELLEIEDEEDVNGMVVEWCSQVRVLAHRAVGCFVTHCGWNSTLESLTCGVPMVCVPKWSDQPTNAKLVESLWGCGVIRSEVDGDAVVKGAELVRCLELVMGDGEKGVEIRTKAKMWKDKALEDAGEGGSSDLNLKAFVGKISND